MGEARSTSRWRRAAWFWALLLLAAAALPQAQESEAPRLDPGEVRQLRERTAADSELETTLREAEVALLDEALLALEAAAGDRAAAADLRRQTADMERQLAALERQLSGPPPEPRLPPAEGASQERAEAALERERAHLRASRQELRRAEGMVEERSRRRKEIAAALGNLDQQEVMLEDRLRTGRLGQTHPALLASARLRAEARLEANRAQADKLRAEMEFLEARGGVIPLEIDLAQRRVALGEELVSLLAERARSLQRSRAQASLEAVRRQVDEAMVLAPVLAQVAAETLAMAEDVWGEEGVAALGEATARRVTSTRRYQAELDRIVELSRRRYLAFGAGGSIQRWWPEIPADFPLPDEIAAALETINRTLPEEQHELIELEQKRAAARSLERSVLESVTGLLGDDRNAPGYRAAVDLLERRRKLLDALLGAQSRYLDQLLELQGLGKRFLEESRAVEAFLYEHLLWSRSVPQPVLPQPGAALDALGWLTGRDNWSRLASYSARQARAHPLRWVLTLATLALLLALRRMVRHRVERIGRAMTDADSGSLAGTLEVLFHTVLLAAPVPLVLYDLQYMLRHAGGTDFSYAAGQAMYHLASLAALLLLARQVLMPEGLGEKHFGWPARVTRRLYREVRWPLAAFLLLMGPALHLAMAGIRLSSPPELQAHNNSLGRVLFMVAMSLFGAWLLPIFRGGRDTERDAAAGESGVWDRLYVYAYPAIVVVAFAPVLLAVFGYYITAVLMSYQAMRTLWLGLGLLLAGGLLFRWLRLGSLRQRALAVEPSWEVADAQVRSMFRFVLMVALVAGLYVVWVDAMPALRILRRVQLWPSVTLLERQEAVGLPSPPEPPEAAAPAAPTAPATPAENPVPLPLPAVGSDGAVASLTLWDLLQALLVVLITVQVVRNVPGLLQLTLQRRSLLDSGARIAIGTLVRYAVILIGATATFGLLGISWSRIQWLAAALTFGLGFGLQEIVANFVSGLILLTERPVRVGDAVTVGNLQGRVTRIQIRATTITLWDQSEMIVPNKEFITTKLINWTLTDSRRRLELPVRVPYGSDLDRVKQALLQVATDNPHVVAEPPAHVLLLDYKYNGMQLELRCHVDFGMGLQVRDELYTAIARAFAAQGLEFARPNVAVDLSSPQP